MQSEDRLNAAKLNGTISTVGFAVGGGAIALGAILYLTAGPSSSSSAQQTPPHLASTTSTWKARPYVGFAQAGLTGEF